MKNCTLRMAKKEDAADILAIYEPYVRNTEITFEYEVPTLPEFTDRITDISTDYPYLVCTADGRIIGYAYAHRHMERAAYQWNAELSIYIDKAYQHLGIGKQLYGALIDILKLQNVKNVYGCVTHPNEKSESLHAYFGFTQIGIYKSAGYKCGAWHDVVWFEKSIGTHELSPVPLQSIQTIDKERIAAILKNYMPAENTK